MPKRKICVVTGSRAEYGLLFMVMKKLKDDPAFILQVITTGSHLSPEFGLTYREIEKDGFSIDARVEMLLSSDTLSGITKSIGLGVIGFADAFERLNPDLIVLLGDRFEILSAAQAALIAKIPVAHIAGGDITEGAIDDAIRHSITKMSHLHFVTNDAALKRIRQLGEDPAHVFNVGSPGIDLIKDLKLLCRAELEESLGFRLRKKNLLITFHPATLEPISPGDQFKELLDALSGLSLDTGLIITMPNADPDGRIIARMIEDFVNGRSNAKAYSSMGQLLYLSCMAEVDAVVGNSSSGLYEAPSFKKPTVNIGDRQKGRLMASSVLNCRLDSDEIAQAIEEAFEMDCSGVVNPYGDGCSSARILEKIKSFEEDFSNLIIKHFFELDLST